MKSTDCDLLIKAGRVFCAKNNIDGPGSVAIKDGKIIAVNQQIPPDANNILEFPNSVLLPGFIDLHAHPAPPNWKYGVDPDIFILPRGTTTILSQGDAGANNWARYKKEVIDKSDIRIRMALSPAIHGEEFDHPVYANFEDLDVKVCSETVKQDESLIWGIAVNISYACCAGHNPKDIMNKVLEIACKTEKPILYGMRWDPFDWLIDDQLKLLRSNDVVTYSFHTGPGGLAPSGKVETAVWKAKEKGIKFDIGHGMTSFNFEVAETSIREGFLPDTISTDFYLKHATSLPRHDMPRTISKLIAAGMDETDAFERSTIRPAQILGLSDSIGSLSTNTIADLSIIKWNPNADPLIDTDGNKRSGGCWEPEVTIKGGKVIQTK